MRVTKRQLKRIIREEKAKVFRSRRQHRRIISEAEIQLDAAVIGQIGVLVRRALTGDAPTVAENDRVVKAWERLTNDLESAGGDSIDVEDLSMQGFDLINLGEMAAEGEELSWWGSLSSGESAVQRLEDAYWEILNRAESTPTY